MADLMSAPANREWASTSGHRRSTYLGNWGRAKAAQLPFVQLGHVHWGGLVATAVICMVMNYPTAWSNARPARNKPNDLVAGNRIAVVVVRGRRDLCWASSWGQRNRHPFHSTLRLARIRPTPGAGHGRRFRSATRRTGKRGYTGL
jgi:hypothetical protein